MPSFSKPPFQAMVTICYENFNWIFSCQSPTLLYSRLHSTFHPIMVKSMIVGIYYYVDRLIFNRKVKHFYFFWEGGLRYAKTLIVHYFNSLSLIYLWYDIEYSVKLYVQRAIVLNARTAFVLNVHKAALSVENFRNFAGFFFAKPHFIFLLNSFSLFRLFKE